MKRRKQEWGRGQATIQNSVGQTPASFLKTSEIWSSACKVIVHTLFNINRMSLSDSYKIWNLYLVNGCFLLHPGISSSQAVDCATKMYQFNILVSGRKIATCGPNLALQQKYLPPQWELKMIRYRACINPVTRDRFSSNIISWIWQPNMCNDNIAFIQPKLKQVTVYCVCYTSGHVLQHKEYIYVYESFLSNQY